MQSTDRKTEMTKAEAIPVKRGIQIELQEALPDGYLIGKLKRRRTTENSWTMADDGGGYREQLYTLIYPVHFDRLKAGRRGYFAGTDRREERFLCAPGERIYAELCSSVIAAVTGAMPGGIALSDMETITSVLPGVNREMGTGGYETEDVLYLFFVRGYDQETGLANSVGGLSVEYRIKTEDLRDGFKSLKAEITARFVAYSDVKSMERDLEWLTRLNGELFTPPGGTLEACLGVEFFDSRTWPGQTRADAPPAVRTGWGVSSADAYDYWGVNPSYGFISYGEISPFPAAGREVYLPAAGAGSARRFCQPS